MRIRLEEPKDVGRPTEREIVSEATAGGSIDADGGAGESA
jgi:hypothetical protein